MCAPPFFWLRKREDPPVELAGVAPVFRDGRAAGQPVYFSEVIVRGEGPGCSFPELRDRSCAYNDPCSLSGSHSALKKLAEIGADERFFGRMLCSGSHANSMELVARGEADAAAIESNVLRIALGTAAQLREELRVIEAWGPFPIQPVVLRSGLDPDLKGDLRAALLTIGAGSGVPSALAEHGLERFAPVSYENYACEELVLRECESALAVKPRQEHKIQGPRTRP
jgi:phosphonate transport system substrate-binding protein